MNAFRTLVLAAVLGSNTPALAADTDGFYGSWQSDVFEGIKSWDNGRCSAVFFGTRHYDFSRPANVGNIVGSFAKQNQARYMMNADGNCRLNKQASPTPLYSETLTWILDIEATSPETVQIKASHGECSQMCDVPPIEVPDFATELKLTNDGALVDTRYTTEDKSPLRYVKQAKAGEAAQSAQQAVGPILEALATLNAEDFVRTYNANTFNTNPTALVSSVAALKVSLRHINSRDLMEQRFFGARATPTALVPAEMGLFLYEAKYETGRSVVELVLISKEQGRWKLVMYYVGN